MINLRTCGSRIWRVSKQAFREFLLPLIVAVSWAAYQSNSISGFISSFGPAFFLSWWFISIFIRINRRQQDEDNLNVQTRRLVEINETTSTVVGHTSKLVGAINEVKELVKDNPVLLQRLEHASKVASTVNTHVTAANNAISEVRGNLASIPSIGQWGDNWSLPPRVPPNPEIYEDPSTRPRK